MGTSDRTRRRSFVIHVFAGLATTTACHHENTSAAPPAAAAPANDAMPAVAPPIQMPVAPRPVPSPVADASADAAAPSVDGGTTGDASSGANVFGALMGDQIGDSFGHGGLGLRGTGRMGGTGEGTIGLGNIGTIGHGGGSGAGYGARMGGGRIGLIGRSAGGPRVRVMPSTVTGSIAVEVIRRITLRHLNEVRFCYEQGLAQNPNVHGQVEVRYVIGPGGVVTTAALVRSDLAVPAVAACTVNAVRRWMFPDPVPGSVVSVVTPFVFEMM